MQTYRFGCFSNAARSAIAISMGDPIRTIYRLLSSNLARTRYVLGVDGNRL